MKSEELNISKEHFLLFACAFLLLLLGPVGAIVICCVSIVATLKSTDYGIKAFTFSFLISFANSILFSNPNSSVVSVLRVLILLTVIVKTLGSPTKWRILNGRIVTFIFFVLFSLLFTLWGSYEIGISLSKLAQFSLGVLTILLAFANTSFSREYWIKWFFTLFLVVLIFSIPFYFVPAIGYITNGTGFQGISNQPQLLGIFLAPFVALILGELIVFKRNILRIILFVISIFVLLSTGGRTAMIAIVVSTVVVLIGYFFFNRKGLKLFAHPFRSKLVLFFVPIFLLLLVVNYNKIENGVYSFLLKRESRDLRASLELSRGSLISNQISNINRHPLVGIGFGLPSNRADLVVQFDPIFKIPINAPVEKGSIVLSIPEEIGYLGLTFFIFFIFILFRYLIKTTPLPLLLAGLTAFFTNIGEATLFSLGGFGLFVWLLLGTCTVGEKKYASL